MAEQRKTKKSEPVDWLREALKLTRYFDYYGDMFDERQRAIFVDYVCNDMSLSEIAERENMTRQGVSDLVKRISNKLQEYEDGLHLVARGEEAKNLLDEMEKVIAGNDSSDCDNAEIKKLCAQLRTLL